METPSVPLAVWPLAALDPVLVLVAVALGWTADQAGKLVIAVIAAVALSILAAWAVTSIGLPWPAPVGGESPLLLPVRSGAAVLWSGAAYLTRRGLGR